eukprot:jgi/Chrzof1/11601/Cz06g01210.t1
MGKVKKSVKKFQQKRLKGVVKHKPKFQSHKRKALATDDAGGKQQPHGAAASTKADATSAAAIKKRIQDMDADEFLNGGFLEAADGAAALGAESDSDVADLDDDDDADDMDAADLDPDSDDGDVDGAAAADGIVDDDAEADDVINDELDDVNDDDAADPVTQDNVRLKGEVARHKAQLQALQEKDPEFYAYLQQTDAELLGFGAGGEDADADKDDDDVMDDEDDESEQEEEDKEHPAKGATAATDADEADEDEPAGPLPATARMNVTSALVEQWCTAVKESASMTAMKQLLKAYRVACHYGDTEAEVDATMRISSAAVYNKVMLFMLKEADGSFKRMLSSNTPTQTPPSTAGKGSKGKKQQKAKQQALDATAAGPSTSSSTWTANEVLKAPRWKKVSPLVKSYLGNSLHLLSQMTESAMLAFTLRRLRASTAFLASFSKIQRRLLKTALQLFGSADNAPRVQAILFIRDMALTLPPPALDTCLKGVYRTYASNAKFVSPATLPHLSFMSACMVEMTGLDLAASYQLAFSAIRDLAVLLRNALSMKTADAYKEVYCWQTVNCLEVWSRVLSAHASRHQLQPLVYPLAQVLGGAVRLVPTPRYFPLRLRIVRAINRLAQSTGFYIPVSPVLLEMLQWSELKKPPQGGATAAPDLLLQLRLSKTNLRGAALQEEVVSQILELLADHMRQWACHIAFPELVHIPLVTLRSFVKSCSVERFRRSAKQLVDAIERNITWVGAARDGVSFAPQDIAAVGNFLKQEDQANKSPLQVYASQLLQKAQARMAMRSSATAQTIDIHAAGGSSGRSNAQADHDDSDDDEQLGNLDDMSHHADLEDHDVDAELDKRAAAGKLLGKRKAPKSLRSKQDVADQDDDMAVAGRDDDGDVVADYELSDDDDDGGAAAADGRGHVDDDGDDDDDGDGDVMGMDDEHDNDDDDDDDNVMRTDDDEDDEDDDESGDDKQANGAHRGGHQSQRGTQQRHHQGGMVASRGGKGAQQFGKSQYSGARGGRGGARGSGRGDRGGARGSGRGDRGGARGGGVRGGARGGSFRGGARGGGFRGGARGGGHRGGARGGSFRGGSGRGGGRGGGR